jgi:hypothetical protein
MTCYYRIFFNVNIANGHMVPIPCRVQGKPEEIRGIRSFVKFALRD